MSAEADLQGCEAQPGSSCGWAVAQRRENAKPNPTRELGEGEDGARLQGDAVTVIAAQVVAALCFTHTYIEQDVKGTVSGIFNLRRVLKTASRLEY